jgi:polar amino acid transport system substrate-binding protein
MSGEPERAGAGAHLRLVIVLLAVAFTLVALPEGQAQSQPAPDPRVVDLLRAGKIRVGIGLGNRASAMKDPATGELQGVAADLARALAARIGLALQVVEYPRPGAVFAGAKTGAWDVTFLVIDPDRTAAADVTAPYMQGDFTYLVPGSSPIHNVADADRAGVRIAVPRGDAVDLRLSRILKRAELVRVHNQAAGAELLRAGSVNAYAAPRSSLIALSAQIPGTRVLQDAFATTTWAAFVPKGHPRHLAYVSDFLNDAKASGLIAKLIAREGLHGIKPVPPVARP